MRATQGNSVARTELQKVAVLDDPVMEGRSKCKVDAGIPIADRDDSRRFRARISYHWEMGRVSTQMVPLIYI